MEEKLIAAGVKNLREYGYPDCNKDNITTDIIYKYFFIAILKENKGINESVDIAIDNLIAKCKSTK